MAFITPTITDKKAFLLGHTLPFLIFWSKFGTLAIGNPFLKPKFGPNGRSLGPDPKKCRCHKVGRTEIPVRMVWSRAPQLLRGPLSWPFPCLCLGATFQQTSANLWAAFGQLLLTKVGDKKCVTKIKTVTFLIVSGILRVCFLIAWISCEWFYVY